MVFHNVQIAKFLNQNRTGHNRQINEEADKMNSFQINNFYTKLLY